MKEQEEIIKEKDDLNIKMSDSVRSAQEKGYQNLSSAEQNLYMSQLEEMEVRYKELLDIISRF